MRQVTGHGYRLSTNRPASDGLRVVKFFPCNWQKVARLSQLSEGDSWLQVDHRPTRWRPQRLIGEGGICGVGNPPQEALNSLPKYSLLALSRARGGYAASRSIE